MTLYGLIDIIAFLFSLGLCIILMIKKHSIHSKVKNVKNRGNVITILLLILTLLSLCGQILTQNYSENILNCIGANILNVICIVIQLSCYNAMKKVIEK